MQPKGSPFTLHTDRHLAQHIQNGDPGAWAAFVDTYGPRLHRLARRYAACEADAEDLTQEIFVALFQSMASFRGTSALATWSYRVALNHCLKHAAKMRPVTVPYQDVQEAPEPDERGPVHQAARRELTGEVQTALDGLSPGHRDVVILHELHEMTYAECAAVLQVPVGTVKSRLSTAFRRLRQSLSGYVLSDTLPESAL
jgi:RNA polymerase sigma-70 factor (ECF subfamily)